MGFTFYKVHGTGNDFIVIDNRKKFFPTKDNKFVRHICARHKGIGADGLLLIEESNDADFRMRFFNSDGYESEMCVNGSRCICYIAFLLKVVDKKHSFETGDGIHSGEILSKNLVKVDVKYHKGKDSRNFPSDFKLPDKISFVDFLNTGVPHVVLLCGNIRTAPVEKVGRELRFHSYYQPEGVNVNFVQINDQKDNLYVRTFERGVDAETLSCGSGVTASVISVAEQFLNGNNQISVNTSGGKLIVTIAGEGDLIFLEGPVKIIYQGKYIEEDIS